MRAAGAVLALALLAAGWHLPIPAADAFLVATQGGGGGVLGFALAWLCGRLLVFMEPGLCWWR